MFICPLSSWPTPSLHKIECGYLSLFLLNSGHFNGSKNIFSDLSTFDNALLIWSYTTGEMRNHQALCVHKDTNRSHIAETMTLWNRWTEGMIPDGNNDFDGKLMFPWHRFGIKIKCGVDVIHSNFSSTYHVSGASRDTVN